MAAMFDHLDSQITFAIPTNLDLQAMEFPNATVLLSGMDDLDFDQLTKNLDQYSHEVEYNRFMGDLWVGVVLTLMIVTSIFCMCACFLFHKFRQWKASVRHFQSSASSADNSVESGGPYSAYDSESLPSYTLVSGLPSYDDALDCYRKTQVSASSRPSIMKLFSFDNPLLSTQLKDATAAGELQQVVVVAESKDGLPSYQESLVLVNENKKTQQGKRTVHKPLLPFKVKQLATIATSVDEGHSDSSTPSTAGAYEGCSQISKFNFINQMARKGEHLPQVHKSPSLVLVFDDDYWRNVHHNQQQVQRPMSPSYSSNSLPRNFSSHLVAEEL